MTRVSDDDARKVRAWLQAEAAAERAAREAEVSPPHRWGSVERVFIPQHVACALAVMGRKG